MLLQRLKSKELINCHEWLVDNVHYLTIMGSNAYGVSSDSSDEDIYGFCIPKKDMIFPHLKGEIVGFGRQEEKFEVWQQHHIKDKETNKQYDFQIFSIIKYFQLCMGCNPNMIDSLFTPRRCIIHTTQVGELVRENRYMFLHKGAFHRFKGYAYSQMHKMDIKKPEGKRKEMVDEFGYDLKFAYHVVRLLNECQMILDECDLDLERNREELKSIRRGEWTLDQIKDYFTMKEKILEKSYSESKLPYFPDENAIKVLLLRCLEQHFGSLDKAIYIENKHKAALREISEICKRVGL
ncbi:MAG: nucleotidyltransferase domain-containing protein [Methanothrix sp.]|jgi:predicted nucleotidyltransferase|nr:nucleotidyltransferase domain-containing protein [Methanothrix sp.]